MADRKLIPIDRDWFIEKLEAAKRSQRGMARHLGVDASAVTLMLQGKRRMSMDEAPRIAAFINAPVEDVIRHSGVRMPLRSLEDGAVSREVPLTGVVDDAGRITFHTSARETVEAPGKTPQDGVAVKVSAREGWRACLNGALMFFRPTDRVEPGAIGRLAIVRLIEGDEHIIRTIRPGADIDRYDLVDGNDEGTMFNVELAEAGPVLWIRP